MHWWVLPCVTCIGVFLVCSAAYTVYTDPDCNLDCVAEVVVVVGGGDGGGSGCLPAMSGATLHALVLVTLCNLYWYVLLHILATAIVTWTVWWCVVVTVVLVEEVVAVVALVGVVLAALAHMLELHSVTCTVWWLWWWGW